MTGQLDIFKPPPRWKPADFDELKLTSEEARVFSCLKFHVGRASAIKVPHMAAQLSMDERKLREILKHLRDEHGIAIGSAVGRSEKGDPPGIFLIETMEEYKEWRAQETGRALSILRGIAAREKQTVPDLLGQLRLETRE